ncbi:DUF222 domain-containing protein [Mycobacterium sp. 23]|uniref:DUF222 domain-containing protein n=1 Tax=Mycobacterium sp. 23 TaxID=3400424 RepID=UPI003AAF146F
MELTAATLSCPELLTTLGELEVQCRRLPVAGHVLINQLATQATAANVSGSLGQALADRLRIIKTEADRRVADAAELGPRCALTGEPLTPLLAATAAAQHCTTRRNTGGHTEWIALKHLEFGRPRTNCMHHPKRHLETGDDAEDG